MALTTPLVKLTKFALGSVLHPIERTKETAAIGRMIVGQVTRAAAPRLTRHDDRFGDPPRRPEGRRSRTW